MFLKQWSMLGLYIRPSWVTLRIGHMGDKIPVEAVRTLRTARAVIVHFSLASLCSSASSGDSATILGVSPRVLTEQSALWRSGCNPGQAQFPRKLIESQCSVVESFRLGRAR